MTREQEQIRAWTDAIAAEIARRRAAKLNVQDDVRAELYARLDAMAARIRAAPDFQELTAEEAAETQRHLHAWFVEHGYIPRAEPDI
jgi:hypothetical protein